MNLLEIFAQVGEGMGNSILIFVLTLVFSLPLGMVLAFGRMARLKVLSFLTKLYISIEKEQIPLLAEGGGIPAGAAPAQAVYLHFAGHPADAAADGGLLWALLYL